VVGVQTAIRHVDPGGHATVAGLDRFDSPVSFIGPGFTLVRLSGGPFTALPRRASTAKLVNDNATCTAPRSNSPPTPDKNIPGSRSAYGRRGQRPSVRGHHRRPIV
jgi:hypothetical protein